MKIVLKILSFIQFIELLPVIIIYRVLSFGHYKNYGLIQPNLNIFEVESEQKLFYS